MNWPSDEILMAYADGELSADARSRLHAHLKADALSRSKVRMFRWTAILIEEATAHVSLAPVPERLKNAIHARKSAREGRSPIWPGSLLAAPTIPVIAGLVTVLGALFILQDGAVPKRGMSDFALGTVGRSEPLAKALERGLHAERTPFGDYVLVGAARYEDKFGDICIELDVMPAVAARPPEAVVVACQRNGADWDIVGAVHTRPAHASKLDAAYATDVLQAHDAVGGILTMIGAKQITTALEVNR